MFTVIHLIRQNNIFTEDVLDQGTLKIRSFNTRLKRVVVTPYSLVMLLLLHVSKYQNIRTVLNYFERKIDESLKSVHFQLKTLIN